MKAAAIRWIHVADIELAPVCIVICLYNVRRSSLQRYISCYECRRRVFVSWLGCAKQLSCSAVRSCWVRMLKRRSTRLLGLVRKLAPCTGNLGIHECFCHCHNVFMVRSVHPHRYPPMMALVPSASVASPSFALAFCPLLSCPAVDRSVIARRQRSARCWSHSGGRRQDRAAQWDWLTMAGGGERESGTRHQR